MQNKTISFLFGFTLLFTMIGCNRTEEPKFVPPSGEIKIIIEHTVENEPLVTNQLIYQNAAGNEYLITEIQWFISDLRLIKSNGEALYIPYNEGVFYIDTDLIETRTIKPLWEIPAGDYKGLAFTFGFDEENNRSNRFVNPPESFMFWPEYLGGGYHYMKLNGKWKNTAGILDNFNFHLGIGQVYDSTATKSAMVNLSECCAPLHCEGYTPPKNGLIFPVTDFIHNHFEVVFDAHPFTIEKGLEQSFTLTMKIENWFQSPHVYDHNHWGGSIMQNQAAMKMGCENGWDVFELSVANE